MKPQAQGWWKNLLHCVQLARTKANKYLPYELLAWVAGEWYTHHAPILLLLLQELHCNLPQVQNFLQLVVLFLDQLLFVWTAMRSKAKLMQPQTVYGFPLRAIASDSTVTWHSVNHLSLKCLDPRWQNIIFHSHAWVRLVSRVLQKYFYMLLENESQ